MEELHMNHLIFNFHKFLVRFGVPKLISFMNFRVSTGQKKFLISRFLVIHEPGYKFTRSERKYGGKDGGKLF